MRATLETRVLEAQAANLSFLETFSSILLVQQGRQQGSNLSALSEGR